VRHAGDACRQARKSAAWPKGLPGRRQLARRREAKVGAVEGRARVWALAELHADGPGSSASRRPPLPAKGPQGLAARASPPSASKVGGARSWWLLVILPCHSAARREQVVASAVVASPPSEMATDLWSDLTVDLLVRNIASVARVATVAGSGAMTARPRERARDAA
jgi:hypothetical protein